MWAICATLLRIYGCLALAIKFQEQSDFPVYVESSQLVKLILVCVPIPSLLRAKNPWEEIKKPPRVPIPAQYILRSVACLLH